MTTAETMLASFIGSILGIPLGVLIAASPEIYRSIKAKRANKRIKIEAERRLAIWKEDQANKIASGLLYDVRGDFYYKPIAKQEQAKKIP